MKPVEFDGANRWLSKPPNMTDEMCGVLPIYLDVHDKTCLSQWRPTLKERLSILLFGRVWLWVMTAGDSQPPVAIEGRR